MECRVKRGVFIHTALHTEKLLQIGTGGPRPIINMSELLIFSHDHMASVEQMANLPSPFDMITCQESGWIWGPQDLTNRWFRLVQWDVFTLDDAVQFLSSLPPRLDANEDPVTYGQYRGMYIDFGSSSIPTDMRDWWLDDTRTMSKYVLTLPISVLSDLTVARPEVLIPV